MQSYTLGAGSVPMVLLPVIRHQPSPGALDCSQWSTSQSLSEPQFVLSHRCCCQSSLCLEMPCLNQLSLAVLGSQLMHLLDLALCRVPMMRPTGAKPTSTLQSIAWANMVALSGVCGMQSVAWDHMVASQQKHGAFRAGQYVHACS